MALALLFAGSAMTVAASALGIAVPTPSLYGAALIAVALWLVLRPGARQTA